MLEKINGRLDTAINNLDNENFEELFPMILDDLKYILSDFRGERDKLSAKEQFEQGTSLKSKINVYFGKLAKLYFKMMYEMNINIVNSSDYNLAMAGGGYNSNDDKIYYSDFGALLASTSDLSFLHTCLHEGRHKMQHDTYKSEDLISFPPYMLRLLKENLLDNSLLANNRKFYSDNYFILFTENDAEIFARREVNSFIRNLMNLYLKSSNKKENDIDDNLMFKISDINQLFNSILKKEEFNIDAEVESQIYDSKLIIGDFIIDEQSVSRMIATDKFIKANPELQEQYPILKLLFNGKTPKSYDEIMADLTAFKENKTIEEQNLIDDIYKEIIISDPILLLSDILAKGDINYFNRILETYPMIFNEYPEEIRTLNEKYGCFGANIK